ncbi:undecaprenyl-diphosphate phosphatase [Lactobacillus psittaci]|uniref:Undecaprenyl-diphosphatase n=1 Tax=Lactobacillus psittaci DSM 15354 TaxID=1122152 RepID=A0A0R1S5H1_9LACO|nr:undecaprenyl-diphosphate phosphatase [Lactobacillus psittaci]KRL63865.1 undecaprenyl-diphosphatase UppP [Lactobacillus psittaci DSM 15354]
MVIINIIKAIILGIIEGITEFLPISSTGHLYLADYLVKLNEPKYFIDMFMVVIQLGAILSIIVIYFSKLNPFSLKKTALQRKNTWILWFKVVVAVIPAMIVGLPLNSWLEENMTNWQVISATLIIYGILFIILENYYKNRQAKFTDLNKISFQMAFLIGCFQVLSLIPGTSRSGATILGAMLIGASRYVSAEFSFFLAIPTMFGASLLKIVKYIKAGHTFAGDQLMVLLVGMVVSFVVAYIAVKFLLRFIQTHDFKSFGWYRIVLGIIVILAGVLNFIH